MEISEGKPFKSQEEIDFYHWLIEAEQNGMVSGVEYEPESFLLSERATTPITKQLKTKIKIIDKFLLHPHSYTPDFVFKINHTPLLTPFVKMMDVNKVYVDIKGTWANRGGTQEFSINQKWMFQKYGIYINKIVPVKLFKSTWVPECCRYTPVKKQQVKKYIGRKTVEEYKNG